MIRRNARLRREYLYRRSVRSEERERLDRKIRIREALEKGTEIAKDDLMAEAEEKTYGVDYSLNKARESNIKKKGGIVEELDDEYRDATRSPPKILLTSSHSPSDPMHRFLGELNLIFPNSTRINRGSLDVKSLVSTATNRGFTDMIVVHEYRGVPNGLQICHLPYGPTAYFSLYNVIMRHDTDLSSKVSEAYPHLIFHNFKTKIGKRCATILKHTFPVPKLESKRIMTFANDNDFISFRHHTYKKVEGKIVLHEVGPRFEMQLYQISLGTIEANDAEREFVLRPYMNTAAKRQVIGHSKEALEEERVQELNKMVDE